MSDDLVKRLRAFAQGCRGSMWQSRDKTIELMDTAADRIEGLEVKLAKVVDAFEKLGRLGNGDRYGNSDGNKIACAALAELKGQDDDI